MTKPYRKAWAPTCAKCGTRHHGLVTCEQAAAAGEEAGAWVDEAPPWAKAAAERAMTIPPEAILVRQLSPADRARLEAYGDAAKRFNLNASGVVFVTGAATIDPLDFHWLRRVLTKGWTRRVVPTYPPSRFVSYSSGPTHIMGSYRRVLAFGTRPDLASMGEIIPARLRIELDTAPDRINYVGSSLRPRIWERWRLRIQSDFWRIEHRIQYRAVARYLVSKLVGPKPTKWDFWREEQRLEGVAWSSDDTPTVMGALKAVRAIRGVAAEHGFHDRHGREWRGFFDVR